MTTTKVYDFLNRLTSISSAPAAASSISYSYNYNPANQRMRSTLADGSAWEYVYDSLGQVVSGHKFLADGTPVAGQQFDYTFDTAGNRTHSFVRGSEQLILTRLLPVPVLCGVGVFPIQQMAEVTS